MPKMHTPRLQMSARNPSYGTDANTCERGESRRVGEAELQSWPQGAPFLQEGVLGSGDRGAAAGPRGQAAPAVVPTSGAA